MSAASPTAREEWAAYRPAVLAAMFGMSFFAMVNCHDGFDSYRPLILAALPVTLCAGLLLVGLGPYPQFAAREEDEPYPGTQPQPQPAI